MKVAIIGTGFVGLTSAAVYASFGNQIVGIDVDQRKIDLLNQGVVSFYEPKLTEMIEQALAEKRVSFTTDYAQVEGAEVIMICVGTPTSPEGKVELTYVKESLKSLAPHLSPGAIVAIKSTVPPGTLEVAKEILDEITKVPYYLASVPEFLKEGTAVDDTLYPDRVVIGATEESVWTKLEELHAPLRAPMLRVSPNTAQLAKYAANDYLASRIVFINEMADICAKVGADIEELIKCIGKDKRIGAHYWYPGLGYGGSCFPKDVKGLAQIAKENGYPNSLFAKLDELNSERPRRLMTEWGQEMKDGWEGKRVAVLGLAFKPNTDDQRVSPALAVIPYLLENGCSVRSYDPSVKRIADEEIATHLNYEQTESIEEAVAEAEVIVALVEWPQIVGFDFGRTKIEGKTQYFIDLRNQFAAEKMRADGYIYLAVGRKNA